MFVAVRDLPGGGVTIVTGRGCTYDVVLERLTGLLQQGVLVQHLTEKRGALQVRLLPST